MNKGIYKLYYLTVILFLLLPVSGNSTHIVGGDITYGCVGISADSMITLVITCTIYRDAINGIAPYDNIAEFGIYRGGARRWRSVRTVSTAVKDISEIQNPNVNPCLEFPSNIVVEKGVYQFEVTLRVIDEEYMIAYQRCCRNETINNIVDPGSTGAAFTVEITPFAQRQCNSSAVFRQFPPTIICVNERLDFDHSGLDFEGDELVYEFCSPLTAGGVGDGGQCTTPLPPAASCLPPFDLVKFRRPSYSALAPLLGDPIVSIDSRTGQITGVPNIEGQFVVGVCVKEFRNGRLMATIKRDFQFNVTKCFKPVTAQLDDAERIGFQEYLIRGCGASEIEFNNASFEPENIFSYSWKFDINGEVTSRDRDGVFQFPGPGLFNGLMILNEGDQCADTAKVIVDIKPELIGDFIPDFDPCEFGPVDFKINIDTSSARLERLDWDFGDGGVSTQIAPTHQYAEPGIYSVKLSLLDENRCRDTVYKDILWQPAPEIVVVEPSTFIGCNPGEIFFNNLSLPIDSTYDVYWEFGDGSNSSDISPTHVYTEAGSYDVLVDITSPIGCNIRRTFRDWIRIEPSPIAGFTCDPQQPDRFNPTVNFTDQSTGAIGWQWDFSGEGASFIPNPMFKFPDTGLYLVELVVVNENSCTDTMAKVIDVLPIVTLHMPNAFTPNNDTKNDLFLGKGDLEGIKSYNLQVYNRWGEMIFQTLDPYEGWNGQKDNNGERSPIGAYAYKVLYVDPRGQERELKGTITLIR